MRKCTSYLIGFAFLLSSIFYLAPTADAQTWTMDRYNPSRTNQGSIAGPRNLPNFVTINNSINGSLIRSGPDGSIITWNPIIGSTGFGQIHRYLLNGSTSWDTSVPTDGFGLKDVSVDQNGTIYVVSMGQVTALNKSTGNPTWAFQGGNDQTSPLAIGKQGTVYFHSGAAFFGSSETVTAIAPDGTSLWQAIGTFRGDSRMVFSTDESTVYLLNTKSIFGSPIGNVTSYSTVDGHKISDTPCDPRGMLFAYAPWDLLYSFATDGASFLGLSPDLSSCPIVSANGLSTVDMAATTRQGRIIIQNFDNSIAIIDQSGNILFNSNEPLLNGFVDSAGVLFAENPQTNEIVAVDTVSLSQLWRSNLSAPITGFSLGSDGRLYVSAGTALLKSAPVQQPVWPMTGHDPQRTGLSTFVGPTAVPSGPSWTFASAGPVIGDLAVSTEGKIYFSSDKLYALNPGGASYVPAVAIAPITSPAIDDLGGFVYVIVVSDSRSYDVLRYSKQLQNPVVVYHGAFSFATPSSMTVGPDGTIYFSDGVSLIAVGPRSWRTQDRPCFGNFLAPALGRDGSVYSMCNSGGGAGFGSGIYRYDGNTGIQITSAGYSRGGTELIIDVQNDIRAGFQAFDGGTFGGSYDSWDANLIKLTPGSNGDFTTSRSALFPDGLSTARIGFSFQPNILEASGANTWGVISGPQTLPTFSTPPTIDAAGNVFVGTVSGVAALNGNDGSTIWFNSLGDTITTQPTVSSDGSLVVGASSGTIYDFALKPLTGTIVVSTNNAAATFTISGPATYSGNGTSFTQSNAPGGVYAISYGAIPGFSVSPLMEGKTLIAGSSISFTATYTPLPPLLSLFSTQLIFSDQPVAFSSSPMTVTLANAGGQPLTLALSVTGDFQQSNDCANSLLPGASCTASISFTPTTTGNRTGALTILDNSQGSPHSVVLSGIGIPAVGRPILFVHGFCGTPEGWSAMELDLFLRLRQQYPTLYTNVGVYEGSTDGSSVDWTFDGKKLQQKGIAQTARFFTIRFSDPRTNDPKKKFDTTNIADVPIAVKGNELAQVLQSIRQVTGQQDVIVITHSMGGLVARAYMENLASPPTSCSKDGLIQFTPGTTSYASDISQIITLDTPHSGSDVDAWIPVPFSCFKSDTVNRVEMLPSSEGGEFIGTLNYLPGFSYNGSVAAPLPPQTQYVAIKSYTILTAVPTLVFWDDVLRDTEQDMAAALSNSSLPKIETVENFFADVPPDLACRPGNVAHVLHLLECVGAQKQTLDRVWNVTHASVFGKLAESFNIQPGGTCKK